MSESRIGIGVFSNPETRKCMAIAIPITSIGALFLVATFMETLMQMAIITVPFMMEIGMAYLPVRFLLSILLLVVGVGMICYACRKSRSFLTYDTL
ncbi:MAG: hypothetical protein LBG86_00995 [Puniceicoccales bacterium]|nr:hypothetical protein [Puniceicoccales bacterium]